MWQNEATIKWFIIWLLLIHRIDHCILRCVAWWLNSCVIVHFSATHVNVQWNTFLYTFSSKQSGMLLIRITLCISKTFHHFLIPLLISFLLAVVHFFFFSSEHITQYLLNLSIKHYCYVFQSYYFLLYKKKKVLVSCKFSISCFWWIYTFWDVLNTCWLFLENVCLSVCVSVNLCVCVCVWQKFCGKCSSRTSARNFMKLYI